MLEGPLTGVGYTSAGGPLPNGPPPLAAIGEVIRSSTQSFIIFTGQSHAGVQE